MPFKTRIKITFHLLLLMILLAASILHNEVIYLFYQSKGQLKILFQAKAPGEYLEIYSLNQTQKQNLELIGEIKKYSEDSLGFKSTSNFARIYNQDDKPVLWVISASERFSVTPYYWEFPIVGKVSYKGFFDKEKAIAEKNHLISSGYDVDLRSVSAWSTLGWFSDPVLSSMLDKPKGQLCNLIFHELFHSTYYAKGSVDFNENLASFIAHKATLQFLKKDTLNLHDYLNSVADNDSMDKELMKFSIDLNAFYLEISNLPESSKSVLRLKKFIEMGADIRQIKVSNHQKTERMANRILESKNAWFVDFKQYNGLQDSLEIIFNKNYSSNIRAMVQSLKDK